MLEGNWKAILFNPNYYTEAQCEEQPLDRTKVPKSSEFAGEGRSQQEIHVLGQENCLREFRNDGGNYRFTDDSECSESSQEDPDLKLFVNKSGELWNSSKPSDMPSKDPPFISFKPCFRSCPVQEFEESEETHVKNKSSVLEKFEQKMREEVKEGPPVEEKVELLDNEEGLESVSIEQPKYIPKNSLICNHTTISKNKSGIRYGELQDCMLTLNGYEYIFNKINFRIRDPKET
ncbi:unnamed protein product [Moneuplotes crassus]|uniref:Uncharacterized protein n=1 Tax=Euplotes crassus TaxID=5936 RepID=A0AAD1XSE3_EUPCR|nr:unnamed protein product [Moneuplotes crassus]